MNSHTPKQRLQIVQLYYQTNGPVHATNFVQQWSSFLNGYFIKQNCQLHTQTVTVWCALWARGIIYLYFYKNVAGHNVTANGKRLEPWLMTRMLMWTTFDCNKTTLHAIQSTNQSIYWKKPLVSAISPLVDLWRSVKSLTPWKRIFGALLLTYVPNCCKKVFGNRASRLEFI